MLVFGGSQGARILNKFLPQIASELLERVPGLTILHQSGARHVDATLAGYQASGADPARWQVRAFLDDMAAQFSQAHLVMARSGASTVAELAAAGKPALLVPFAAAADQHQRRNAEAMVEAGAAVLLHEWDLAVPGKVCEELAGLLTAPERLAAMAAAARTQAHPGAAERIADRLAGLADDNTAKMYALHRKKQPRPETLESLRIPRHEKSPPAEADGLFRCDSIADLPVSAAAVATAAATVAAASMSAARESAASRRCSATCCGRHRDIRRR